MIGTRGVPARYGGFETAVEEIGRRLVERGQEVTVYCRGDGDPGARDHLGMRLVHLPAVHARSLETLSHTAVSVAHLWRTGGHDVATVFNAANAPFLPALRAAHVPVAVHVDGLEWQRDKWSGTGRHYYRWPSRSPCGGPTRSSPMPRGSPTTTGGSSASTPSCSRTAPRSSPRRAPTGSPSSA